MQSAVFQRHYWRWHGETISRNHSKRVASRIGRVVRLSVGKDESSETPVTTTDLTSQNRIETNFSDEGVLKQKLLEAPHGLHKKSVKYSGLKGNPLSCGVNSATESYELPSPAVAARNLVWNDL